jgi:hypothetical protein
VHAHTRRRLLAWLLFAFADVDHRRVLDLIHCLRSVKNLQICARRKQCCKENEILNGQDGARGEPMRVAEALKVRSRYTMDKPTWNKGDRVTWHAEVSRSFARAMPGVVTRVASDNVTIEFLYRLGDQWVKESRHVSPSSLVPRKKYVPGLDGPRSHQ